MEGLSAAQDRRSAQQKEHDAADRAAPAAEARSEQRAGQTQQEQRPDRADADGGHGQHADGDGAALERDGQEADDDAALPARR